MTRRDLVSPDADHRLHDRLLIVRSAAGDLHASEVASAEALVAHCPECAALADELRSIALATASLPTPTRPRDFRLSKEQAAALRGSPWARLLRWLATPRAAILQPLASAAVAIGLVLVVVGNGFLAQRAAPASDKAPAEFAASPSPEDAAPAPTSITAPAAGAPETPLEGERFESTLGAEATVGPEPTPAAATGAAEATPAATAGEATDVPGVEPGPGEVTNGAGPSPGDATAPSGYWQADPTPGAPLASPPYLRTSTSPAPGTTEDSGVGTGAAVQGPSPSGGAGQIPDADRTPAPTAEPVLSIGDADPSQPGGSGQAIVLLGVALAAVGGVLLGLRFLARRDVTFR